MCKKILHSLACGHDKNNENLRPFEILACGYFQLSLEDKGLWEAAKGPHQFSMCYDEVDEVDLSAICEGCQEEEKERARDRLPLWWPMATGSAGCGRLNED